MPDKKQPTENARIGHNSSARVGILTVGIDEVTVWPPAQEQADDVIDSDIDEEVTVLKEAGQRRPLPARIGADGKIEIVAAAHVLRAIERFDKLYPENVRGVEVRVHKDLTDGDAFRILAQDADPVASSSLARGLLYMRAVDQFGSEAAVTIGCRVSKSTVSKNLDVARAHAIVRQKVHIGREINQRDGMWLMRVVGREPDGKDAPNAEDRAKVLETLGTLKVAPANKLFAQLRAALKVEKPHRGEQVLRHGDREIARTREKKGQIVRIDLADVGDIELDTIVGVLREALAIARRKLI